VPQALTLGEACYGSDRQQAKWVDITNFTGLTRVELADLVQCRDTGRFPRKPNGKALASFVRRGLVTSEGRLTTPGMQLLEVAEKLAKEVYPRALSLFIVPPPSVPRRVQRRSQLSARAIGVLLRIAELPGIARDAFSNRPEHSAPPRCLLQLTELGLVEIRQEVIPRLYLTQAGIALAQEIAAASQAAQDQAGIGAAFDLE
jgi:hypothetical protein